MNVDKSLSMAVAGGREQANFQRKGNEEARGAGELFSVHAGARPSLGTNLKSALERDDRNAPRDAAWGL